MEDFKKRLLIEKEELDDKRIKLRNFLQTDNFNSLDDKNRNLLIKQFKVMTEYSNILKKRIGLIINE